jgi:hypothetical protein
MKQEEAFDGTEEEKLHLENELLELRLRAELGARFAANGEPLPPEIEQRFLEQVIAFHQHHAESQLLALRIHLGNPYFKPSSALPPDELPAAWKQLSLLLEAKGIRVDFLKELPLAVKYDFITQELFDYETELPGTGGQAVCFIYEVFHQDHDYDIRKRSGEFMEGFFAGRFPEKAGWYLADELVTECGDAIPRGLLQSLLERFHGLFSAIRSYSYHIDSVSMRSTEGPAGKAEPSIALSEGIVRYNVLLSDGQQYELSGPFKLHLQCVYDWWEICYFQVHGFSWRT